MFRTLVTTLMLSTLAFVGCAKKVSRIDPNSTIDLSGKWNDTDSRLVAEKMIQDCLNNQWYGQYQANKKIPTIIIGNIRNKSHEHISVETFSKDIERTLINSGKVEFVASKNEREQLREEIADMQENASVDTRKDKGEEQGSDLMMIGTINSIVDKEGDKAVVFYQIDMELIQLESNRKLWIGNHKIKKYINKSAAGL
jgi:penicillin-binding protein activator